MKGYLIEIDVLMQGIKRYDDRVRRIKSAIDYIDKNKEGSNLKMSLVLEEDGQENTIMDFDIKTNKDILSSIMEGYLDEIKRLEGIIKEIMDNKNK